MSESNGDHENIRSHNDHVREVYEDHLADKAVDSPEASHWVDQGRVDLRFDVLTDIGDLDGATVLDFGCGNALFRDYLQEHNVDCEYVGWDISPEMIDVARDRHPEAEFEVIDVLADDLSQFDGYFDYVFVSGVFHIRGERPSDQHETWYKTILETLWPLCTEGLGVNFFSEFVDWKEDDLYYCTLNELVPFCVENLSRWYQIRHDYDLYELTTYIYKHPEVAP